MKLAVAGIALMLLAGCATQPSMLDQAAALHNSRMQEYAAIRDPDERARKEYMENYRYRQFLAGAGAILEQSARVRMYEAQTEAARAQAEAARAYQNPPPPGYHYEAGGTLLVRDPPTQVEIVNPYGF